MPKSGSLSFTLSFDILKRSPLDRLHVRNSPLPIPFALPTVTTTRIVESRQSATHEGWQSLNHLCPQINISRARLAHSCHTTLNYH